MNVLTLELHLCVCVFLYMATVHSGPTACYIKTTMAGVDLAFGLHELTMADELWTRCCCLETLPSFPLALSSSAHWSQHSSCVWWHVLWGPHHLPRWYQSDGGFAFYCLTGCYLVCSLTGTDGIWGCGPGAFTLELTCTRPRTLIHPHSDMSHCLWLDIKRHFFFCLYNFSSPFAKKVALEIQWVKSNHTFCSVRQRCWFFRGAVFVLKQKNRQIKYRDVEWMWAKKIFLILFSKAGL